MKPARYLDGRLWVVLVAGMTACGVPGVPKPPSLQLPQPVSDLRAMRKGNIVYLAWSVPTKTTDQLNIRHLGVTRVCRSTSSAMTDCAAPVAEVAAPSLPAAGGKPKDSRQAPRTVQATYKDSSLASLVGHDPAGQISYAVSVLNQRGRSAGVSNIVSVPSIAAPAPPSDFQALLTAEGVTLSWTGTPHVEAPHIRHLYRVYRRDVGTNSDAVVAELPYGTLRTYLVLDHTFQWERTYLYRATVVSLIHLDGKPETQFEGADASPVKIVALDVFPPGVPKGLQAAFSGVGQQPFIDLIWAPDADADLAGYNVYRREEGGQSRKLNPSPVKTPAFRDPSVTAGHTYFYSITAVDTHGNESEHSNEESEKAP